MKALLIFLEEMSGGSIVLLIIGVLVLLWLFFYLVPIGLWFNALISGVRISLLQQFN
jgi:uncharacterized protein YqfA (UPF0365 family)